MRVLGIETSCDETAVAIVEAPATGGPPGNGSLGRILANVVYSQLSEHRRFGGVVPEIAARAHLERIDGLVEDALTTAGLDLAALDGIAATGGPGLIGGVMVGVMTAKALAFAHDKPFLAINHLEGHALSVRLSEDVAFPYLLLLVSGGHCQLLTVRGPGDFTRLGTTIDDAVGECFDKTAKLLGLGFPGGPAVERAAMGGDPQRFALPRPMWRKPGCDFSFSGLKTAVRQTVEKVDANDKIAIADLCASFQRTVGDVLADRCANALASAPSPTLVVAGGVAANLYLRSRLEAVASRHGARLVAPPVKLCTDNGAMIAWAGIERLRLGRIDALDFRPRPRWPLDPDPAIVAPFGCRVGGMSITSEIVPLFSTPVVISDVPDAATLNAELRKVIEQRHQTHPGTQHSNLGGWQSSWDMDRWGGAPAIKLLAIGRNLANRATTDREGKPVTTAWRANMWANINRSGHGNEFHSHPGSFWSCVYYVDDGGIAADPALGGELEFMDPRGPGPAMYAPHLAFAMPGGLSVGANETVLPRTGRLVMFPAWLLHQVRPYRGGAERISIAFNLSL